MPNNQATSPFNLALPLMYTEPHRTLGTAYVTADGLEKFEEIRQAANALGVTLSLSYSYRVPAENRYFGVLVLDLTDAQQPLERIANELKSVPGVTLEQVNGSSTGLVAFEQNRLNVAGTQMTVIAQEYLGGTYRRLLESLGDQAVELLFQSGEAAGQTAASAVPEVADQLGIEVTPDVIKERFSDLQVFGWATVAELNVDDQFSGETRLTDTFEAGVWDGQATSSTCHWIRGFISGVLSTALETPFQVHEPECQAKGDEYCRMTFER